MSKTKRNCDVCKKEYMADNRNLKRGWGLCCSKSCASKKREISKPTYNAERVKENNIRRILWNDRYEKPTPWNTRTVYDEFGHPLYEDDGMDDIDPCWDGHK